MPFKKKLFFLLFTGLLSSATFALSATNINTPFPEIDRNSDGAISTREAKNTWLAPIFIRIDLDNNGLISLVEYSQR